MESRPSHSNKLTGQNKTAYQGFVETFKVGRQQHLVQRNKNHCPLCLILQVVTSYLGPTLYGEQAAWRHYHIRPETTGSLHALAGNQTGSGNQKLQQPIWSTTQL